MRLCCFLCYLCSYRFAVVEPEGRKVAASVLCRVSDTRTEVYLTNFGTRLDWVKIQVSATKPDENHVVCLGRKPARPESPSFHRT